MILELGDGTQFPAVEASKTEEYAKKTTASVFIRRSKLDLSSIELGTTEGYLLQDSGDSISSAEFGGIIMDADRSGAVTELMMESFERLAIDAQPTPPDEIYGPRTDDETAGSADSTIIQDAIDAVPGLSVGTIETIADPVSLTFNNATQAKKMREVENITGGYVKYNSDKTVDYLSSLGSYTGVTLSPSNQNITGDFSANRISGPEEDITHLRVIGTGEGRSQLVKNIVPADDSSSYDNQVTYTNPNYSDGDHEKWFVKTNKDIDRSNALEEYGVALINDIVDTEYIDVKTTVEGISSFGLGDTFDVDYPEEDINNLRMETVKLTTNYTPKRIQYEVTLSSRRVSRKDSETADREDLQRFNQASQGQSVAINATGGRQPVESGTNYQMKVYYPDEVIDETRINVRVMGLPYRAYSRGASGSAQRIENEVPQDEKTASGYAGNLKTVMRYPGIASGSTYYTIYDNGEGEENMEPYTITDTGDENNEITFSGYSDNLEVSTYTPDASDPGYPVSAVDAAWVQKGKYDLQNYSSLEIDWAWSRDVNTDSYARAGVAIDSDSVEPLSQGDTTLIYDTNDGDSGFSVKTDTIDVSSVVGMKKVRVHSYVETSSTNSASGTVNIYRLEYVP